MRQIGVKLLLSGRYDVIDIVNVVIVVIGVVVVSTLKLGCWGHGWSPLAVAERARCCGEAGRSDGRNGKAAAMADVVDCYR